MIVKWLKVARVSVYKKLVQNIFHISNKVKNALKSSQSNELHFKKEILLSKIEKKKD